MSRIRNLIAALMFSLLPFLSTPAHAVPDAMDAVPAASLLFPYFEVDFGSPQGSATSTVMTVVNTSATAILANVTIWSDWGTPVLNFPVYLTGYDVATWNMYDIIARGVLPQTASAGQDPSDTISHHGPFSQDINFASCNGTLPLALLPPATINGIQSALTGRPVSLLSGITNGTCVGRAYGDFVARGYVTVDTTNQCTPPLASDPTYYTGAITHQNVMWGDYMLVNPATNTAQGGLAQMLESKGPGSGATPYVSGDYTFYGRFSGYTATDQREALASHWIVQGETDFTRVAAWRDPKSTTGISGVACGTTPANQPFATSYAHAAWFDSFATDVTANASFGSAVTTLSLSSTAPLSLSAAKKLGFIALGLEHTVAGVPTVATQGVAQAAVIAIRQPRTNGKLGTTAAAFPVQQVMSPNAGFGRVVP